MRPLAALLLLTTLAHADTAVPSPQKVEPGSSDWRGVQAALDSYCRNHHSTSCRHLTTDMRRDPSNLSMSWQKDVLEVSDYFYYDLTDTIAA